MYLLQHCFQLWIKSSQLDKLCFSIWNGNLNMCTKFLSIYLSTSEVFRPKSVEIFLVTVKTIQIYWNTNFRLWQRSLDNNGKTKIRYKESKWIFFRSVAGFFLLDKEKSEDLMEELKYLYRKCKEIGIFRVNNKWSNATCQDRCGGQTVLK